MPTELSMTLDELQNFAKFEKIKVISNQSGKVLIHAYNRGKHGPLGQLKTDRIFTELEVCGSGGSKNWAQTRLVAWADEGEYKILRAAANLEKRGGGAT